jgi:hypothetical protein
MKQAKQSEGVTAKEYQAMSKTKGSKYKNEKVQWNGNVFDSRKELKRYKELMLLVMGGEITDLRRQVKYVLLDAVWAPIIGKRGEPLKRRKCIERATEYVADFVYVNEVGVEIVEDVKSEMTRKLPVYIMKRKLMRQRYGIAIKEV